jgi:hypothetical protein
MNESSYNDMVLRRPYLEHHNVLVLTGEVISRVPRGMHSAAYRVQYSRLFGNRSH